MTLYELTGKYLMLMEMAEDENIDQQIINDTLEGLEGDIEERADACANMIKTWESEIQCFDAEIERLSTRKRVRKNNIEALKRNLENTMLVMDKKKFKTDLFAFNIQKNAPSLELIDEELVPDCFYEPQPAKLDRKRLLSYIKENGAQEWGTIKQTESLRIR